MFLAKSLMKKWGAVLCLIGFACQLNAATQAEAPSKQPSGCICTKQWDPVCGVDGKTYGNACEAECAKVVIVKRGACSRTH